MKIYYFFCLLFYTSSLFSQIVFLDNFGTGCNTGTQAVGYNGWTQTVFGTQGVDHNIWYVSAAENGVGAGNCGAGCGADPTLHISATTAFNGFFTLGDLGAAYYANTTSLTDKRIESPVIDCSTLNPVALSFDYIENGEGTQDNATVWYSPDAGITWVQVDDPPKTALCGGQGLWATRTLTLPASANNNPNVKIGFRWVNDADANGTDPSFAIDDSQVGVEMLGERLLNQEIECEGDEKLVTWETAHETSTQKYVLMGLEANGNWTTLANISAKNQTFNQYRLKLNSNDFNYFKIKSIDYSGNSNLFPTIILKHKCEQDNMPFVSPNPTESEFTIYGNGFKFNQILIFESTGKKIKQVQLEREIGIKKMQIQLKAGVYHLKIANSISVKILKLIVK